MHPSRHVVRGQYIEGEKLAFAKELRRKMTCEEALLWEQLRGNRLRGLHFRRQQIVDGFIVDFYCDAAALAIELDGGIHKSRMGRDAYRESAIRMKDVHVLRFPNHMVRERMPEVMDVIEQAVARQASSERPLLADALREAEAALSDDGALDL